MADFQNHTDVAEHMGEPVEAPEWFDHQVAAFQDKVVPWINDIQGTNKPLEDVRLQLIEKMEKVCGIRAQIKVWTTEEGVYAFDIEPVANLERYDPERQAHEVRNNLLDIPEDRGRGVIKTDPGVVRALADGDTEARKLWTPGAG
jgi:hypothetical protein